MKSKEHYTLVTFIGEGMPKTFRHGERRTGAHAMREYLATVALIGTVHHRYAPSRSRVVNQIREVEINVGDGESLEPQGE